MRVTLTFRQGRLRRVAVLAGVGALAAAGSVLGGAQAHAAVPASDLGNGKGTLVVSPATGPTNAAFTVASPDACPNATAATTVQLRLVKPTATTSTSNVGLSQSVVPTAPFTADVGAGSLSTSESILGIAGTTAELVVECFPNGPLAGGGVYEDDAFLQLSADGTTYTQVSPGSGSSTSVNVGLTASPSPATSGQSVTLTATTTPSAATGTIQFENNGTDINDPVTISGGTATTTFTAPTVTTAATEALTAVYTPTSGSSFTAGTQGSASLTVNPASTTGGNSGTIPLSVTVPSSGTGGGSFTLTVDTADTVTLTTSGATATGTTSAVTVADTRSGAPGWSVSGQDAAWTGTGTAAGSTFSGDQLGWAPTDTALATGATLGGTVAPASPGLGTTAGTLASAPAGSGGGTSTLGANLTLAIPATATPGPYTSGLTISAVTSAS